MFLSLLGQNNRTKSKRPTGFYQPLQEFCHKSEGCSPEEEGVSSAHIGRKVIVSGSRVGTLRYYGACTLGEGQWCGVELESENGDHDGLYKGVRYFACPPRRGILVRESEVALVPQVRYISEVSSSGPHSLLGLDSQCSTPGSPPLSSRHSSSAGSLIPRGMDVPSKHSSFELDESLGILTPDQMSDFTLNCPLERSPSAEELSSFMLQDIEFSDMVLDLTDKRNSLEIKDEKEENFIVDLPPDASELSESVVSKKTDVLSTSNSARSKKESSRVDRTPSLEDLPLDSAGDTSTDKTESFENKTRAPNSFITSITSITSLDNGYQGDGEWSRPASRGPEHSPSGKGRCVKSRLDPMTDSDFFTESDADMAEEWGHRRAQVIDGTLYGGGQPGLTAQGQVQRFSPSNEEMDSSGIYSDLEKRPEDQGWIKEEPEERLMSPEGRPMSPEGRPMSPEGSIRTVSSTSDQSLKKLSTTSFSSLIEQQVNTIKNLMAMEVQEEEVQESKTADSTVEEKSESKKFKTPKRTVVSKIKIMISSSTTPRKDEDQENRVPCRPVKKGRWDAVMNKIAQGQAEEKTNPKLKEVKSKVFSGISSTTKTVVPPRPVTAGCRKAASTRNLSSAQSISTRSLRDITTIKSKSRRTRIRSSESSLQGAPGSQASSRNSSVSDLSQPKPSPTARSGKKRDARCTSPQSDVSTNSVASQVTKKTVVTPPRAKTPIVGKNVTAAEKTPLVRKTTPRRGPPGPQHKPQPLRDQNRGGGGGLGGRAGGDGKASVRVTPLSPTLSRPPPQQQQQPTQNPQNTAILQHAAKGAQAFAVLVHHLVYNLDAFSTPQLKKDLDKIKSKWLRSHLELEELKVSFNRLQEEYILEKNEKERELEEVEHNHKCEVDEMHDRYKEEMDKLTRSFEISMNELQRKFEMKEKRLSKDLLKRLQEAEEMHLSEKAALKERCQRVEDLEAKLRACEEAQLAFNNREEELLKQVDDMRSRYENLKEGIQISAQNSESKTKLSNRTSSCSSLQAEVDSLQCVLEIRCSELQELRRHSQIWKRDAEQLPAALQRVSTLISKVTDLQTQIARKEEIEKQLQQEKQILSDTIAKESSQKKRLSLQNEELQWKLKQNSLVFNALAGISNPGTPKMQKTPGKSSKSKSNRSSYELNKTASDADISINRLSMSEKSPPGSPTVKSVIEKTDSVSWVLDLQDPPECVASRILRRAIRSRTCGSPSAPGLETSPIKLTWEPQAEAENITEEVIMVKGIGGNEVLELLSVDDGDIFIDDLPKRIKSDEEAAEMLRRVGERDSGERTLPKDSAGEAMISGEASDEEPEPSESEEETTSSGGDLSEDHGTRLFRLNGTSDSGSLNMSWSEDVDILPSEG